MKRFVVACVGLAGLGPLAFAGGAAARRRSSAALPAGRRGPRSTSGLQLDRLLSRHQRRRRLGPLPVGRRRQVRRLRRPDRRHHRLQLAIRPGRWSASKATSTGRASAGPRPSCVPLGCETRNHWLATVRGRVGYAFDRFLPYLTAGLAVGDINATRRASPAAASPPPAGPSAAASRSASSAM